MGMVHRKGGRAEGREDLPSFRPSCELFVRLAPISLVALVACGFPDFQADLPSDDDGSITDGDVDVITTDADAISVDGDARNADAHLDALDAPTESPSCPDAGSTAKLQVTTVDETAHGLGNVTVLFSNCASKSFTTDATGALTVPLPIGAPLVGAFATTGRISTLSGELKLTADWSGAFTLLPTSFETSVPKWAADKGAVYVAIVSTGLGACAAKDGVTFTIAGHPEAVVSYVSTTGPLAVDTTLTSTSTEGAAVISNVAGGVMYTISGSKPGCAVFTNDAPYTGNVPVVNGSLTVITARLG